MTQLISVTTKGQVTIPDVIRRELGILVGDKVTFRSTPHNREVVLRVIPKSIVQSLHGSLQSSVRETNHAKARSSAGKSLGNKYQV